MLPNRDVFVVAVVVVVAMLAVCAVTSFNGAQADKI